MDVLVLDKMYDLYGVLDTFESFIWSDRYNSYGDFEIYMPVTEKALKLLKEDYYIAISDSDRQMLIEKVQIQTNVEDGNRLIVSGRSLESILERRIVWYQTTVTGSFQDAIQRIINENIISPSNQKRKIPGFRFKPSTDPKILALTIDEQFFGEDLYSAIKDQCQEKDIGFRVTPYGGGGFEFELYGGSDRSYSQNDLPWVIFSPNFDNLLSSNYLASKIALKTAVLTAGEGEGADRKVQEVLLNDDGGEGLTRREVFLDASEISSTIEDGVMPEEDYAKLLIARGKEALAETKQTQMFEGEMGALWQFVYGRDFFIGDIVQVANEYGIEARSRVSEVVRVSNVDGDSLVPTFTTVDPT